MIRQPAQGQPAQGMLPECCGQQLELTPASTVDGYQTKAPQKGEGLKPSGNKPQARQNVQGLDGEQSELFSLSYAKSTLGILDRFACLIPPFWEDSGRYSREGILRL